MSRLEARDRGREINVLRVEGKKNKKQKKNKKSVAIQSITNPVPMYLMARSGVVNHIGFLYLFPELCKDQ